VSPLILVIAPTAPLLAVPEELEELDELLLKLTPAGRVVLTKLDPHALLSADFADDCSVALARGRSSVTRPWAQPVQKVEGGMEEAKEERAEAPPVRRLSRVETLKVVPVEFWIPLKRFEMQ
jgi:hypothetical protein